MCRYGESYTTGERISMGINLPAGIIDGIPIVFTTGGFNGGRLKVMVHVGVFSGGRFINWTI